MGVWGGGAPQKKGPILYLLQAARIVPYFPMYALKEKVEKLPGATCRTGVGIGKNVEKKLDASLLGASRYLGAAPYLQFEGE